MRTPIRLSAWAATGTSRLCASSTAAAISSIVSCGWPACRPVVIIPPVAISLIEVAPLRRFLRVARRTASGPSACRPIHQPCPPVIVMTRPLASMCGPAISPAAMSAASSIGISPGPPTSRIVVTPARTVASSRAMLRTRVWLRFSPWRTVSGSGPPSRQAWAWAFISPGVSHRPPSGDHRRAGRPVGRRVQSLADRRDPARPDQHVDPARSRPSRVDDPRVAQEEVGHTRSLAQRPLRVAPDPP